MKTSAAAWKNVSSKTHSDKLHKLNEGMNSRQWKRRAVRRSQQTKIKTNKTNKGFK